MSEAELNSLYERCLERQQAGKFASAEKLYAKLLKVVPNNPEVLRSFASLRFAQGHHAKAIDILERARALHPRSAALEYSLGKVFLELGRAPEAEPRFRACLAISPGFAEAVANLGATQSLLGRYAEAVVP